MKDITSSATTNYQKLNYSEVPHLCDVNIDDKLKEFDDLILPGREIELNHSEGTLIIKTTDGDIVLG